MSALLRPYSQLPLVLPSKRLANPEDRHDAFVGREPASVWLEKALGRRMHQRDVAVPDDLDADAEQDEGRQSHHDIGAARTEPGDKISREAIADVDGRRDRGDADDRAKADHGEIADMRG